MPEQVVLRGVWVVVSSGYHAKLKKYLVIAQALRSTPTRRRVSGESYVCFACVCVCEMCECIPGEIEVPGNCASS